MVLDFKKKLRPFQGYGSDFLTTHPHALLADEPGLGKTVQVIHAAACLRLKRVLVICPASVRMNWCQELRECGTSGLCDVISYEQATKMNAAPGYDGLILDEVHYLKTADSKRTQAIFGPHGVARDKDLKVRWALSGTPVLNRPRELWPLLKNLHPEFSQMTWPSYARRYCGAYHNGREIDTRGASNLEELKARLSGFMLRRTEEEVGNELPKTLVSRVPLELEQASLDIVEKAEREILDREARISIAAENTSSLGDLSRMLHATGYAKVTAVADFVNDLLETQEKVVVFFKHTDVGNGLALELALNNMRAVTYQGGMSDERKTQTIEYFKQTKDCRVFLGQIQAAGTGINGLQEVAHAVVFAELSWVPGEMQQAIRRLARMGQKSARVHAYLLHAPGTMESAVLGVQNAKGSVVGKLMGEEGWKA